MQPRKNNLTCLRTEPQSAITAQERFSLSYVNLPIIIMYTVQ